MIRASPDRRHVLDTYYGLFDDQQPDRAYDMLTEDARLIVGNAPPIVGRERIRESLGQVGELFAGTRHELLNVWEEITANEAETTLIAEVAVTYSFRSRPPVTVTCVVIASLRDGQIAEQRLYGDFAATLGQSRTDQEQHE